MELVELWQNIHREAVQLAETVAELPDECECGDAEAHLEGRCHCCIGQSQVSRPRPGRMNCVRLLALLQADLMMLSEDLTLAGPPTEAAALEKQRLELRRGVFMAASDLQRIVESLKRVSESVAGFRVDCSVSRLRAIKRHSAELRDHCEQVNAELSKDLQAGTESPESSAGGG